MFPLRNAEKKGKRRNVTMPMPCRPRYAMLLFYLAIHIPMFRVPCPHIRPPYFPIPYPPSHVPSHTLPPYPLSLAQSTKTPSCIRRQKKTLHQCQPPQDRGGLRHRNVFARGPRPSHSDVVNPPKTYHRQWYKRMVTLSPRRRPSQTRSLDPLLHPSRHRDPRPRPGVATRW